MLWHVVHAIPLAPFVALCVPRLCRPKASLNCATVAAEPATPWHAVHCVPLLIVPPVHAGVVWPPWQLTFEHVSAAPVNVALPAFPLNVALIATDAGPDSGPSRASAFV
jgi:hypothetical protein